jgi:hypothetical protein
MKKASGKGKNNLPRRPAKPEAELVQILVSAGLNADAIAAILNVNKNTLRAEHALTLHNARATLQKQKAEAEASDMTRAEMCCANAILTAFADEEWFDPVHGCDLWPGLNGGGAKSASDAFAAWLAGGGRFITAGINKNFGPDRIAEFRQLKADAEKLLRNER